MTNVEKLAESLEAQAERTAADAPEYSTCIRIVARQIREAIEADRQSHEELWAVCINDRVYTAFGSEAEARDCSMNDYGGANNVVRILVPASPEPDKETP